MLRRRKIKFLERAVRSASEEEAQGVEAVEVALQRLGGGPADVTTFVV